MYVKDRARWATLCAAPAVVAVLISSPHVSKPPTENLHTRLLATSVVAPTQIPILLQIHGHDLINVLTPYLDATYGTPTQPIGEITYPASSATDSISIGVAALQGSATGDPAPVMAGISQGAVVISVYKQAFNAQYAGADPASIPKPTFVLVGNPSRPNGGLSERFAGLGIPAIGGTAAETIPTPTETAGAAPGEVTTYDYARQYDFFADFPNRPLNVFATTNALFGAVLAHGSYGELNSSNGLFGAIIANDPYGTVGPSDAVFQEQVGDTAYYMIPSPVLPMLQPLAYLGVPEPFIAALDAPLRVLVEAGYDRTISPGRPTPAQLLPVADPLRTLTNFLEAIPTGLDDGLQQAGLGRPFQTTPAGPYGVGGPPVTLATPTTMSSETASETAVEEAKSVPAALTAAANGTSAARDASSSAAAESSSNASDPAAKPSTRRGASTRERQSLGRHDSDGSERAFHRKSPRSPAAPRHRQRAGTHNANHSSSSESSADTRRHQPRRSVRGE